MDRKQLELRICNKPWYFNYQLFLFLEAADIFLHKGELGH